MLNWALSWMTVIKCLNTISKDTHLGHWSWVLICRLPQNSLHVYPILPWSAPRGLKAEKGATYRPVASASLECVAQSARPPHQPLRPCAPGRGKPEGETPASRREEGKGKGGVDRLRLNRKSVQISSPHARSEEYLYYKHQEKSSVEGTTHSNQYILVNHIQWHRGQGKHHFCVTKKHIWFIIFVWRCFSLGGTHPFVETAALL